MRLLWHSIERHLQEADFLLEVWADCLEAPDYTLDELGAGPEARVIAQLDGLAVAGTPIVDELLMPTLERDTIDSSLACAATLALFDVGTVDDCAGALEILDAAKPEDERWLGIVRGLQLSERDGLDAWILDHLHRGGSNSRVSGLAMATAVRGLDPGPELAQLLRSHDPWITGAAARIGRNSTDTQSLEIVGLLAHSSVPEIQRAAVETGLVRRLQGAWESALYWAFTSQPCAFRRDALAWVGLLGDPSCQRRLLRLLDVDELAKDVLWAVSFGGHIEAVDAAVALLTDDELGPLAGEVVSAIAGAPLGDESLWTVDATIDDDTELPALEVDLDTDLDENLEARLPHPNPEALAAWWTTRREQLADAPRLLDGRPWSPEGLIVALHHAPLRRRHMLALELQIRSGGSQRVDTHSWTTWQLEQLSRTSPIALTQRGYFSASSA